LSRETRSGPSPDRGVRSASWAPRPRSHPAFSRWSRASGAIPIRCWTGVSDA